ncbi:MAG: RNA polymerase sigma-54 factor [Treponema sp.]
MSLNFSQTQKASQKQVQKLNQVQIQSLKYLSMNSVDLRSEIYAEVEKNPSLEIASDGESGDSFYNFEKQHSQQFSDYTKVRTASSSAQAKSEAFQEILESKADTSETLSEHLLSQFELIALPKNQNELGKKLIHNLDKNGFHLLAPVSFLNYETDTEDDLKKCLSIIQNLEPCGCCCKNVEESLFIQAKAKNNPPQASLFILDGHIDFLDPPVASKVLKRIRDFVKTEKEKAFSSENFEFAERFDEDEIQHAIKFIQSLDPYPAREFAPDENSFVVPEIYVKKIPLLKDNAVPEFDIISGNGEGAHSFVIQTASGILPEVTISKDYRELLKTKSLNPQERSTMEKLVLDGKAFLESLKYRSESVFTAAVEIVKAQIDFFEKGPGNLVPFRQKDLAEILGVHETTISRIANSKYLECEWGLFPLKYFFVTGIAQNKTAGISDDGAKEKLAVSNAHNARNVQTVQNTQNDAENTAGTNDSPIAKTEENRENAENSNNAGIVSKDRILFEMQAILSSRAGDEKQLSDQKLADLLAQKGIKIARRTVAKYRAQIGVKSSYDR